MRSLRLPGWTGTGRRQSGRVKHVSHGKPPADCGRWVVRMTVEWIELATHLGSIRDDGGEWCDTDLTSRALEALVGEDNIRAAVELVVSNEPGRLLAQYVLVHMRSPIAAEMAYDIYQTSDDRSRAYWAAHLIALIGHPRAFAWIPVFLSDDGDNVAHVGMDLLDGLLSSAGVDLEPQEVERLLMLVERHPSAEVRRRAVTSRVLLQPGPQADRAER